MFHSHVAPFKAEIMISNFIKLIEQAFSIKKAQAMTNVRTEMSRIYKSWNSREEKGYTLYAKDDRCVIVMHNDNTEPSVELRTAMKKLYKTVYYAAFDGHLYRFNYINGFTTTYKKLSEFVKAVTEHERYVS